MNMRFYGLTINMKRLFVWFVYIATQHKIGVAAWALMAGLYPARRAALNHGRVTCGIVPAKLRALYAIINLTSLATKFPQLKARLLPINGLAEPRLNRG